VRSTIGLEELFGRPLTPREWSAIQKRLACALPPLEFVQGHWFLPDGFTTIWDLVDHAARAHPEWEPPLARTETAWREAQIFVRVRTALVDAGSLDEEQVVRSARLTRDLGF
jgi:hypothetical protein